MSMSPSKSDLINDTPRDELLSDISEASRDRNLNSENNEYIQNVKPTASAQKSMFTDDNFIDNEKTT
jgi:hypothetical protein